MWDRKKIRWVRVTRWVWEQVNGPIPDGMVIMHTCDNPPCFLLDHLRLGTKAENSADMRDKGRSAKGSRNGMSILTEDQVREIREMMAAGYMQKHIAKKFKVSPSTITSIKKGRRW